MQAMNFIFLWKQNDWGLYKRRNEAMLLDLAGRDSVQQVLHVEPVSPRNVLTLVAGLLFAPNRSIRRARVLHIKKMLSIKPLATQKNNVFITSLFLMYAGNNRLLRKLSTYVARVQWAAVNALFKAKQNIVLVAYPPADYLPQAISAIKHDLVIADVVDDVVAETEDPRKRQLFQESYRDVLPRCAYIMTTSSQLVKKFRTIAQGKIETVPNGVDVKEFAVNDGGEKKNKLRKAVGYSGVLNQEVDFDLLEYLLGRFPEVDFRLIGFSKRAQRKIISRLRAQYANLYHAGEMHFSDMPRMLAQLDVLVSLKKDDHTTAGGDSIKIYEYLATGLPIVTTPVSPARRFKEILYVAEDYDAFVTSLRFALAENNVDLQEARRRAAAENSWARRVDVVLGNVEALFLEREKI